MLHSTSEWNNGKSYHRTFSVSEIVLSTFHVFTDIILVNPYNDLMTEVLLLSLFNIMRKLLNREVK